MYVDVEAIKLYFCCACNNGFDCLHDVDNGVITLWKLSIF